MKTLNYNLLASVAVFGLTINPAQANDLNFTPHYTVAYEGYLGLLTPEQNTQLTNYLDYEAREPCQNYRIPPTNFYRDGCKIMYNHPQEVASTPSMKRDVLASYVINFDFDKSEMDASADPILHTITQEIMTYKPSEVTVAGHTDRSGAVEYNMDLSERRANSVSRALTARGVSNQVIDQEKYGESDLAVDTKDGVRLRENRRVVVDFLK